MATEKVIPITGHDNRHVHAEDNGQVDNDTVHVSKSAGHQVTWSSRSKAIIAFSSESGSPFEETTSIFLREEAFPADRPKRRRRPEKRYKYSVVGEKGVNDPTVIIHN